MTTLPTSALLFADSGRVIRQALNGSTKLAWHIDPGQDSVNLSTGDRSTEIPTAWTITYLTSLGRWVDNWIDLDPDVLPSPNADSSQIRIYTVNGIGQSDSNVVGLATEMPDWIEIQVFPRGSLSSGFATRGDLSTFGHEIGHALGLGHPYDAPEDERWNQDDTIMSYNPSPKGWGVWFTPTDIQALQDLWGDETDRAIISGSEDTNLLIGGNTDELLRGFEGNDVLIGAEGEDRLEGGDGSDVLRGGRGSDLVFGGTGDDRLFGGNGHDQLFGGLGDDQLIGGPGMDLLQGGAGIDTFELSSNQAFGAVDIITDFNDGVDMITFEPGLPLSQITVDIQGNDAIILNNGQQIARVNNAANLLTWSEGALA